MIYLLHIDTAVDTGTVAVSGNGIVVASRSDNEMRNHASTINIMIGDVLADVGMPLTGIDGVVVCGGPGSYTGLRIGMATAKGLCYALDKPLFVDNRLTLLAYGHWSKLTNSTGNYISLIKAREQEYFIAVYDSSFTCIVAPQHIRENQLPELIGKMNNTYIVTDAPTHIFSDLGITAFHIENSTSIDLSSWAVYAFDQYKCNSNVNFAAAEPFYLKQVYTHK